MPDIWMDVDAAVTVPVNLLPLIAVADFKAVLAAETYNEAGLELIWNFVTTAGVQSHTAITPTDTGGTYDWVNVGHGMYNIELPADVNNTEGCGWFTGVATDALPWRGPVIGFRAAALNDALIDGGDLLDVNMAQILGTAVSAPATAGILDINLKNIANAAVSTSTAQLGVNVVQLSADATAADNAEAFFDGTGYAGTNNVIPLVTTTTTATNLTNLPAAAATAAELAKVPKSDSNVSWNATALAAIQQEAQDAITASALATAANLATLAGYVDTEVAAILAAVDTEVAAIKAKTDNLPASPAAVGSAMTLAAAYDAAKTAATQASVDDIPTNAELATALGTADDATLAAIAALNNLSSAQAQTAAAAALTAYDPPTKGELDSAVGLLATAANLATLAGYVDTEVAAILAAVDTEVAAIKAKTDNLPASPAAVGSAMTLTAAYDAAKTAATQASVDDIPTNAELATALGTADDATLAAIAALNNLSSAQAQTAAAAALTAYDPPTNAEMEARTIAAANYATAAALTAVDDYVDTEIAAIKAVTDKLDTALVLDGAVYQYTANALELAPAGGGGTGLTAQQTADAVHNLAPVGVPAAGSIGKQLADILADTGTDGVILAATQGALGFGKITVQSPNSVAVELIGGEVEGDRQDGLSMSTQGGSTIYVGKSLAEIPTSAELTAAINDASVGVIMRGIGHGSGTALQFPYWDSVNGILPAGDQIEFVGSGLPVDAYANGVAMFANCTGEFYSVVPIVASAPAVAPNFTVTLARAMTAPERSLNVTILPALTNETTLAQLVRDAMMLAPSAGAPDTGSIDKHMDDILEDTGTTLPSLLAGLGSGSGTGAYTDTVTDGANPLDGVRVQLSTDTGGSHRVYEAFTNASGVFNMRPDPGTYYRWLDLAGYTFTQGTQVVVP
jgi:hypothetical protein